MDAASGSITRRKTDLETGRRRDAVRSGFACACISGNGTSAQTAERKGTEKEGTAADAAGLSGDCDKIAAVVKCRDESSKVVERIANDYLSYMRREEVRKAYEILVEICREMERGLGEKEAYEQLGERWGLLSYRTLSSILVQCLQKGSNGV